MTPIKNSTVFIILCMMISMMLWGCGEQPSAPPEVEFGSLEINAYYDSSFVDTNGDPQTVQILAPFASVKIDDELWAADSIPILIENIVPGLHNVELNWIDYNTTVQVYVEPNDTAAIEPVMTEFALAFTSKAMYYDLGADQIVYVDPFELADYLPSVEGANDGEIILLFYFGAS